MNTFADDYSLRAEPTITWEELKTIHKRLKANAVKEPERTFCIFNPKEYVEAGWFTQEEVDSADHLGYVGNHHGMDCYLTSKLTLSDISP